MRDSVPRTGPFQVGERVLLIDAKDRRYLISLVAGSSFQSHTGVIEHDEVIGSEEGSEIIARRRDEGTSRSRRYLALRPTLSDLVMKMPRGAQVIYPKDLGAIILAADIAPGDRVFESGVGSGALSMAVLRAGAEIVGYELRSDFAATAKRNVKALLGPDVPYFVDERDAYDGVGEKGFDSFLLDLPEPWRMVVHAEGALRPGGIFVSYLPTINQTAELRETLERSCFGMAETFEILRRTWHIEGRSVRPDHRMVAHTGFLTTARLLQTSGSRRDVERETETSFDDESNVESG